VITLTKGMAAELGPDKIRVNALCPVAGDTPLLPSFLGGNTEAHRALTTARSQATRAIM